LKKLLLVLLISAPIPALAGHIDDLFDSMQSCTFDATKATEYTAFASAFKEENEKADFDSFIASEKSGTPPQVQAFIQSLADLAWKKRNHDPSAVGMEVYRYCLAHKGTRT